MSDFIGNLFYYLVVGPFWLAWKLLQLLYELIVDSYDNAQSRKLLDEARQAEAKREAAIQIIQQQAAKIAADTVEKGIQVPPHLSEAEQALLVGKSSNGMYFEVGRCLKCGQALSNPHILNFCADACVDRAMAPFLRERLPLEKTHDYMQWKKGEEELFTWTNEELANPRRRKDPAPGVFDALTARRTEIEQQYQLQIEADRLNAIHSFFERWEQQRAFILSREQLKLGERTAKDEAREAVRLQKEQSIEAERAAEEERWKPKKFDI
jgi:hypothetical protein